MTLSAPSEPNNGGNGDTSQYQQLHDGSDNDAKHQEDCPPMKRTKQEPIKLGASSGLTVKQRRILRREQRALAIQARIQIKLEKPEVATAAANNDNSNKDSRKGKVKTEEVSARSFGRASMMYMQARQKNNELFEKVRYARELALDADTLDTIAGRTVQEANDLIQVAHRYCTVALIEKLQSKFGTSSGFDWKTLGNKANHCIKNDLSNWQVTFLSGPLSVTTKKTRKRRNKTDWEKEDPDYEEALIQEIKADKEKAANDRDRNCPSEAERQLKHLKKRLKKESKQAFKRRKILVESNFGSEANSGPPEKDDHQQKAIEDLKKRGNEIDAADFLLDPTSFTRSVENMFNASCLVKHGLAKMKVRKIKDSTAAATTSSSNPNPLDLPTGWVLGWAGNRKDTGASHSSCSQCVMSFTMADWRRLCGSEKSINTTKKDVSTSIAKEESEDKGVSNNKKSGNLKDDKSYE